LANRIGIIHQGKLLEELELDDIVKRTDHYMEIKVDNDKKASLVLEQTCGIQEYKVIEPGIIRVYRRLEQSDEINRDLVRADVMVKELSIQKESLEYYFLKLTGGEAHE